MMLTSLRLFLIDLTVDVASFEELFVSTRVNDAAAIHNDDHVSVHDGRDSLSDDDLRGLGDIFVETAPDVSVGLHVDC